MEVATRKFFIERSVQFEEDQLYDEPPSKEQEGINTLPFPFDDDILSHVSYSNEEEQYGNYIHIEVVPHDNIDPNPAPIPNQWPKPKWAQNLIEVAWNVVGDRDDRRRTRSKESEWTCCTISFSYTSFSEVQQAS